MKHCLGYLVFYLLIETRLNNVLKLPFLRAVTDWNSYLYYSAQLFGRLSGFTLEKPKSIILYVYTVSKSW
jgi:hypothetical protein